MEAKRKLWRWCCDLSCRLSISKNSRKIYFSSFLRSFFWASLTFRYLWYSSSTASAANDNLRLKRKHYSRVLSRVLSWNCWLNCEAERLHACAKCDLEKSTFDLHIERALKNSLSTKLISQKLIRRPSFFNAKKKKKIQQQKECKCQNVRKTGEWNFCFYLLHRIFF